MELKISVVVPTYRRPDLLLRCLRALRKQNLDFGCFEVIVVTDGPDSSTEKALKKVKRTTRMQLSILSTAQKKGPAAARNLGWLNAKGKVIAFTDDDCIPASNWLSQLLADYKDESEIVFTGKVQVPISEKPTDYERNVSKLESAEFVTANCVCTKKALMKVGGFDERFKMAWREDSDLHFKFIEHGIPIKLSQATVVHPVRRAPWGVSLMEQKKGVFNALLYKKYPRLYRQRIKPKPSWNYYSMVLCFFTLFCSKLFLPEARLIPFIATLIWLVLLLKFIFKRLRETRLSFTHVLEMVFTSLLIPFLSLYWQFYGSIKYRVLFL